MEKWEADPRSDATGLQLRAAGGYYRGALGAVLESVTSAGPWKFKIPLKKADLTKRNDFIKIGPNAGRIRLYNDATVAEGLKKIQSFIGTLNGVLKPRLNVSIDLAPLQALVATIEPWQARTLAEWKAIYPDWIDKWIPVIHDASAHYRAALTIIAQQTMPSNAWTFVPGLNRATLLASPGYFTDASFPVPCDVKEFKADAAALDEAYVLRNDGLFPFRLYDKAYDLAGAREALASAAAQVGFALSFLLHKAVRPRLLLAIEGGKFKHLSDGAILIDNLTHPKMILKGDVEWTPFGLSMAANLGVAFTSHHTPMRLYALAAHELAHSVIIQHWFNADGAPKTEHDQSDTSCMMGYPYLIGKGTKLPAVGSQERTELENFVKNNGEEKKYKKFLNGEDGGFGLLKERLLPENYLPHFCGKCNLQLRGWNISAGGENPVLPRSSEVADRNQDRFPVAGYDPLTFDTENDPL